MTGLAHERCSPQAGKTALSAADAALLLAALPGWNLDGGQLCKSFHFANYHETLAFVNATAWVSHREDHHPDISLHYNRVVLRYSTHDAGGLTRNDFICAAKIEALLTL